MPTTGGIYSLPTSSWYPAVADTDIDPDDSNATLADIAQGLTDRVMADGSKQWTGDMDAGGHKLTALAAATTNGDAVRYEQLTALSGTYQPLDATLTAWAALSTAADKVGYWTGSDTCALADLSSVGRTLLAQSTQALMRTTGLGTTTVGDALATAASASAARTTLGEGTISTFDEATAAQFQANTSGKALSTDKVWTAADFTTLTDASTVAVDMSTGFNFSVTLGGNRTLGNPTNTKNNQSGVISILQDGAGSRTLAYGSNWKFASGTAPVLTTTAAARDLLFYQVISSTFIYAMLIKDVK